MADFTPIRMNKEDAEFVAMKKKHIAHLLMTQLMAGGNNDRLRLRCNELAQEIKQVESKYEVAA